MARWEHGIVTAVGLKCVITVIALSATLVIIVTAGIVAINGFHMMTNQTTLITTTAWGTSDDRHGAGEGEGMKTYNDQAVQNAYEEGRDCGTNGPNKTNCHFSLFATPEMTKAWEQGKADTEKRMIP